MWQVTLDVMQALKEDLLFRCMYVTDSGTRAVDLELALADCPAWSASGKDVELESIDVGDGPGVRQASGW